MNQVDTREKILDREAAERLLRSRPDATVVSGYFDPLLAAHVRRLREIGDSLIVIVRSSPSSLMDRRAREELLASLSCVAFVIPEECSPGNLVSEDHADARRTAEFVEHVRRRAG